MLRVVNCMEIIKRASNSHLSEDDADIVFHKKIC